MLGRPLSVNHDKAGIIEKYEGGGGGLSGKV